MNLKGRHFLTLKDYNTGRNSISDWNCHADLKKKRKKEF